MFGFVFRYYKKFKIPDMERCNIPLEQSCLTIAHANNTLIVSVSIYLNHAKKNFTYIALDNVLFLQLYSIYLFFLIFLLNHMLWIFIRSASVRLF